VARRPSSSPAAASANAPVHVDTTRAPRRCASRSAATSSGEGGAVTSWELGTMTVCARANASSPCGVVSRAPFPRSTPSTPPPPSPQTSSSYRDSIIPGMYDPKTAVTTPISNVDPLGVASTATVRLSAMAAS
jgi:hypothetical protein